MPHQCIHCGRAYPDGSREVLHGCSCGSKFFFYLSQEKLAKMQQEKEPPAIALSVEEKNQIEEDVRDIIGVEKTEESPIVLDFESIRVLKPGKYVVDLHNLFTKDKPLVYTLEEGKYVIDLTTQLPSKRAK